MNREFTTTSKLAQSASGLAAIVSTVLMITGIAVLAEHYSADSSLAQEQPTVIAQR
jgi:hypothetical protein